MKILKWAGLILIVFLIVSQLYRPTKTNPPIDPGQTMEAQSRAPADVVSVLYRGCGDCHSNRTLWPWYSNVAPVSWLILSDVNGGRSHMNLSAWTALNRRGKPPNMGERMESVCRQITEGDMPPWYYLLMHHNARLSTNEIQMLCDWARSEKLRVGGGLPGPAAKSGQN